MGAFFTGSSGSLLLDNKTVAAVQSWTLNVSVQTVSTKKLGDTDDTIQAIGRSTTGSCRVLYYQEVLGEKYKVADAEHPASAFLNKVVKARETGKDGADLLQGNVSGEKFADLKLKVDDTSTGGRFIELRVLITNISLAMSVGEIFAADIQFQANGAPIGVDI
ncbi:phage major tail protein 2 [uncultured Mediterranean phage MEDS3 group]|nr:hypothetical protein [uncultured phage MedDCM-OCT-S08-C1441]AFX83803.1 phage major tail protein 2 [uncultured Mediterranean phage MEDS3 group]BAR22631.1 phage major tail protein 2 [uncultured Mediterranean phage uvMED]